MSLKYFVIFICLCAVAAAGDTIVIQPDENAGIDTYISALEPTTTHGELPFMCVGYDSGNTYWSLIKFSALNNYIGREVISATLTFYLNVSISRPGTKILMAKTVTEWNEDVVWQSMPEITTPYYTFDFPDAAGAAFRNYDITPPVTDWLAEITPNYGLCIFTESSLRHLAYASTCEDTNPTLRPKLTLELEPVGIESTSLGLIKGAFR